MLRNQVLPFEMFGTGNFEFCHVTASLCTEIPPVVSSYRFRCLRTTVVALTTLILDALCSSEASLCPRSALQRYNYVTRDHTAGKTAKVWGIAGRHLIGKPALDWSHIYIFPRSLAKPHCMSACAQPYTLLIPTGTCCSDLLASPWTCSCGLLWWDWGLTWSAELLWVLWPGATGLCPSVRAHTEQPASSAPWHWVSPSPVGQAPAQADVIQVLGLSEDAFSLVCLGICQLKLPWEHAVTSQTEDVLEIPCPQKAWWFWSAVEFSFLWLIYIEKKISKQTHKHHESGAKWSLLVWGLEPLVLSTHPSCFVTTPSAKKQRHRCALPKIPACICHLVFYLQKTVNFFFNY